MRLNINKILCSLFLIVQALFFSFEMKGQCTPLTAANIDATFCPGQLANISLDDPDAGNRYQWFNSPVATLGNYGIDGSGREFVSAGTQTSPQTFYYQREIGAVIGPATSINTGGALIPNDGINNYGQSLTSTQDFVINSVSVIAEMPNLTTTYGFNLRYIRNAGLATADTVFSDWISGTPASFISLGSDLYRVNVPVVNVLVENSLDTRIEIISSDDGGGTYSAVPNFYWFGANKYSGDTYVGGAIVLNDPTVDIGGIDRTPLLMNWDIGLVCPREPVTTTLSSQCCIPVEDDFNLTSPILNPQPSDFNVLLTASGPDITSAMYYYWYDQDGILLADGQGLNTYNASSSGQYEVRIVNEQTDISSSACYNNRSIILGIQSIFAPEDFTVCVGEPIFVSASGSESTYEWEGDSPDATSSISNPNNQETQITLTETGVYTFTVTGDVKLGNIAKDGKFELFDELENFNLPPATVFQTTYGRSTGDAGGYLQGNHEFRIDDRLLAYSANGNNQACNTDPDYFNKVDPITGTTVSRGQILYADPPSTGTGAALSEEFGRNNYLWQLTNQPVIEGETYTFTVDISKWNAGADPQMMLLVNGTALPLTLNGTAVGAAGTVASIGTALCEWSFLEATYTVPIGTTQATITVAEVGKEDIGHELAIDDVTFFAGRGPQSDDVIITVNDDCQQFEARDDSTICAGDDFPLYLNNNSGFFKDWKDASGSIVSTTENASAFPAFSQTYTGTVQFPIVSFVNNSDFTSTDIDFMTYLELPTGGTISRSDYFVGNGNNSLIHNHMLTGFSDHTTGTVNGNSFIGWLDRNVTGSVFEKDIVTIAGKPYGFSVWVRNLHNQNNPANASPIDFDVRINGTSEYTQTFLPGQDWSEIKYTWVATGGATKVELFHAAINEGELGFALDDISLVQLGDEVTDETAVTVNVCTSISLEDEDCDGSVRVVSQEATGGVFTGWYDDAGVLVSTDDTLKVTPSGTETYTAVAGVGGTELIENGDMGINSFLGLAYPLEGGDDVTTRNDDLDYRKYGFTDNANFFNKNNATFPSFTGDGRFLMVNTRANPDQTVYETLPITVENGANYSYSIDVASILNPSEVPFFTEFFDIEISINGVVVNAFDSGIINTWTTLSGSFLSNSTTAQLSISMVDKQSTNDPGPDRQSKRWFATGIDNVSLSKTTDVVSETIEIAPCCTQLTPSNSVTSGTATICSGNTLVLTATPAGGTTSPVYQWYKDNVAIASETSSTYTVPTTAAAVSADYTVSVTSSSSCSGESAQSNSTTVVVHGTPTATLSGDTNICDASGVEAQLDLELTGTQPWTVVYNDPDDGNTALTPNPTASPALINVSNDGSYSLVSVSDANCPGTVSGTVMVDYHEEVAVSSAYRCSDDTPLGGVNLDADEFQIVVTVTSGDLATLDISETSSVGGITFTREGTTNQWYSNAIDESNTIDINVTDENDCDDGEDITGLNTSCSCPASADVFFTTTGVVTDSICSTANSNLTVNATGGSGNYNIVVTQPDATTQSSNNVVGGNTNFTVSQEGDYTVSLVSLGDGNCNVSGNSVAVSVYDNPMGSIEGDFKICADSSDTLDIDINITSDYFPVDVVITRREGGDTTITLNSSPSSIPGTIDNSYSISSITDDNGCLASASDISGTANIDTVSAPKAFIFSVDGDSALQINMTSFKEKFTNGIMVEVVADSITDAFIGKWTVDGLQGDTLDTRQDTITVEGLDDLAVFPDTAFGDVGITRLVYSVQDTAGICDLVTDTLKIIKVEGGPQVDAYTINICTDTTGFTENGRPLIAGIEEGVWVDINGLIEPAGDSIFNNDIVFPGNITPGTYTFHYVVKSNLKDVDNQVTIVTLNVSGLPGAVDPVLDTIRTCDVSTRLTGVFPSPGTGVWSKVSGVGDLVSSEITLPNATVENLQDLQTGLFRWVVSNGACLNKDTSEVVVLKNGQLSSATIFYDGNSLNDDTTIKLCLDLDATETISNGGFDNATENGMWSILSPTPHSVTISEDDSQTQSIVLNSLGFTELQWEVSDKDPLGCPPNIKKIKIEVVAPPSPQIAFPVADSTICDDENLNIIATNLSGGDYQWYVNGNLIINQIMPVLPTVQSPGEYTIVEDNGTCTGSSDVFEVFVLEVPTVSAGEGITTKEDEVVRLNGSTDVGVPTWSVIEPIGVNGLIIDENNLSSELNTKNTGGNYTLRLTSVNQKCPAFDDVTVKIREIVKAPNVFSPNGDGNFDVFMVEGLETYDVAKMYIYNRWGHPVFISNTDHYNDDLWDGENVPEGIYFYTIDLGLGKKNGHTGVIHVIR